jgi:hypothetical protein
MICQFIEINGAMPDYWPQSLSIRQAPITRKNRSQELVTFTPLATPVPAGPAGPAGPIAPCTPPGEIIAVATALPTGIFIPEYPRFSKLNVGAPPEATM